MKIVFHGANTSTFHPGFADLLDADHDIAVLDNTLSGTDQVAAYCDADVIIGTFRNAAHPPVKARLFQIAAAGFDAVDFATLPAGTSICNVFGHEPAIAEYVMAALLARQVPLQQADADLRQGNWRLWPGVSGPLRGELGSQTMGIVGFGHIGQAIAARARGFGMAVHVANRSAISDPGVTAWLLSDLHRMLGQVDIVVVTLPLADSTRSLIDAAAFAAMRPDAVVVNVGRGPVIDEVALYAALKSRRIGGAIIDTWYQYPSADTPDPPPSAQPFHDLPNVTMTPHMSGWTHGTIRRRQQAMAENINRLASGRPLLNTLR